MNMKKNTKGDKKMSRETLEDILIWGFVIAVCVFAVWFHKANAIELNNKNCFGFDNYCYNTVCIGGHLYIQNSNNGNLSPIWVYGTTNIKPCKHDGE